MELIETHLALVLASTDTIGLIARSFFMVMFMLNFGISNDPMAMMLSRLSRNPLVFWRLLRVLHFQIFYLAFLGNGLFLQSSYLAFL